MTALSRIALAEPASQTTEIGDIPTDWMLQNLGELCEFINGDRGANYPSKQDFVRTGIPFVNAGHLKKERISASELDYITQRKFDRLGGGKYEIGDILFCLRGSLGKFALVDSDDVLGAIASSLVIIRPRKKKITRSFLATYLSSNLASQMIKLWAGGAAQPNLGAQDLARFVVPMPTNWKEQENIGEALSDMGGLIQSLDALIAKKCALRQGAMRELLSGCRRLPGFGDNWVEATIKDIAPLQRGFDLPNSHLRAGYYPVVYSNGILNFHSAYQVKGPGVVTGRSGTLGAVTYVPADFWPHNTSLWVTSFCGNDPRFIFYLFTEIGFARFASGSGVPTLNRNDAHTYKVIIPKSVEEQSAIASLLTDLDEEIDLLTKRLDKIRRVKHGMMSELLTGRVRLA